MATHDYVIANGTGAAVRSDLNGALAAIVSNNSSATAPATTYAYQFWVDTTTGLLKQRNAANSAWITIGTLASTNLGLATLASPTFTGTPAAPTAAVSTNTTQLATTAYVVGQASSTTPAMNGTAAIGTGTTFARADHVHASDTSRAPLASPTFTGTPAAPTASVGTNTTQLATTAFVLANTGSFPAGTAMLFAQTAAPTGWTKSTTHDNKALRVVSGTASSGGSTAFTSVFASRTPAGSVDNTTLTIAQIPSHDHTYLTNSANVGVTAGGGTPVSNPSTILSTTGDTGGGGAHNHGFTGTAMDFAVQYVDLIIASKN